MELVRGDPSGMRFLAANWMRVMVLAFAGALVLLAGACGSSKSGETVRQTPVEGEQGEGGGNVMLQVSAREYSFVPDSLQVRAGEAVQLTMTNDGEQRHSLSVYEDDEYKTLVEGAAVQPAAPGESKTVSFQPPQELNELYFRCEIHNEMTGNIEIGPAAGANP